MTVDTPQFDPMKEMRLTPAEVAVIRFPEEALMFIMNGLASEEHQVVVRISPMRATGMSIEEITKQLTAKERQAYKRISAKFTRFLAKRGVDVDEAVSA